MELDYEDGGGVSAVPTLHVSITQEPWVCKEKGQCGLDSVGGC